MKKETVFTICLFLIGLLFMYASVSKYIAFETFIDDMHKQPFPNWFSTMLVYVLPPLEILICVSFIFDKTRMAGIVSSFILMTLFTVYAAIIYFGIYPHTPCSCGGIIRHLTWGQHLSLNSFYTIVAFIAFRTARKINKESISVPITYQTA